MATFRHSLHETPYITVAPLIHYIHLSLHSNMGYHYICHTLYYITTNTTINYILYNYQYHNRLYLIPLPIPRDQSKPYCTLSNTTALHCIHQNRLYYSSPIATPTLNTSLHHILQNRLLYSPPIATPNTKYQYFITPHTSEQTTL